MIASTNPLEILAPPLASLLAFFYDHVIANYGVAIILMTLTVMVVLAPLTWKGTRSMLAMQRLQPELKKIQQQHKNDRAALNEAMMAFYKEHNINPLGGCLPLLLQMPVFFGLYRAVAGLTHKVKGVVHPKFIPQTTKLAIDLRNAKPPGTMKSFGFDLAKSASAHHSSFAAALPYLALIALIMLTGWYQQKQLTNVNPQAAQANPQAAMMQKIFPIFFGLITYRFPAGVALYWLSSSVARIAQQWAMYRWDKSLTAEVKRDILEVEERTADLDKSTKATRSGLVADTPKRKGFLARMMEAAATQQEAKASGAKPGTKPSTTKPSTSKPAGNKPAGAKPAGNKPATGKTSSAKPATPAEPADPAASNGAPGATGKGGNGADAGGAETPAASNGADPPIRPNRPAPSNRAASRKRARRGR